MSFNLESIFNNKQRPVIAYRSEKSIALSRSFVTVNEEIIKSIEPFLREGINPTKGILSILTGTFKNSPIALAISTLIPQGFPPKQIVSNGGYESSIPTRSIFACREKL